MKIFNDKYLHAENIEMYQQQFANAKPFPNIAFDNFLDEEFAKTLRDNFPGKEAMRRHYKGLNEQKSEGSNFDQYHESFQQLRDGLAGPEFIGFLEQLTGIEPLQLPDDMRGAGVHQGENGSFLDVHVDFSVHPVLNIHRRLNVLIFLSSKWDENYGGALELWDKDVKNCEASILPVFNRCAIFATSDISYHGYSKINVPEGVKRNSFFSYFYTPITEEDEVKYHDTIFKTRPSEGGLKKFQTTVKENAKNFVKGSMKKLGLSKVFDKIE